MIKTYFRNLTSRSQRDARKLPVAVLSRWAVLLCALTVPLLPTSSVHAADLPEVRIGVLSFGTVNWEMDVIRHHGLDQANGISLRVLPYASNRAGQVALQAGEADVIVADWILTARLRAGGADMTFVPYSTSIGSVMVPGDSDIKGIADLKGKRVGIAGGPLDKSWLLLRADGQAQLGFDLGDEVDAVFGAPPLLNEELKAGRLDAVLTYWHYAARLEVAGMQRLVSVSEVARKLGDGAAMPSLGFVFSGAWAEANPASVQGLVAASRAAKQIMATSDDEWSRLEPILKTTDPASRDALRDGFRAGIPKQWGPAERQGAEKAFSIMRQYGGDRLTGRVPSLTPGTFWHGADF
jgi:NitT/TauT family transport system substrate-binding protein